MKAMRLVSNRVTTVWFTALLVALPSVVHATNEFVDGLIFVPGAASKP